MSLCCEIGCRERLPLGIPSRGTLPGHYAAPVEKKSASEGSKEPVTAEVALSECYMPLV
ncbi:Hypothetical protein FKW44_017204 [Caligus rogercresseyi]|uniref:Uncharacterized protein n=1 Tax=Caligus rogercresseyi TaxID=217165 RepID=A0A7T8H2V5_CALRO|nr:Hypothetical protein FKW44_017204 [Caligus rogercresseyi]